LKSEGQALRGTLETSNWKLDTSKLGSFCAFHSPAEPQPTRQPPLPTYPIPPKFGFVLHDSLRETPAPGRNWVRFAQSLFGRAPRPAGPRPFPGARAKLGSFCTITFGGGARPEGRGQGRPAPTPPGEIGFVLRIWPPAPAPGQRLPIPDPGPPAAKLGSFRTQPRPRGWRAGSLKCEV
jgi:hypothetical protein